MGSSFVWLLYRTRRKCSEICRCMILLTTRAITSFSGLRFLLIRILGSSLFTCTALPSCMTLMTSSGCPTRCSSVLAQLDLSKLPLSPIFTPLLAPCLLASESSCGRFSVLKDSSKPSFIFMPNSSHLEMQTPQDCQFTLDLRHCLRTCLLGPLYRLYEFG
jgi:hypothetical protein